MNLPRKSGTFISRAYRNAPLRALLFLLSFLIVATIVVGARARLTYRAHPQPPATETQARVAPVTVTPQGNSAHERVETELITITRNGFEPAEITRPKGSFFLEVDNRSGLSEINIRLDSEHGNRIHHVRVRREQLDWHQKLDLNPGHYVLTESNHPDWACHITITAR